LMATLLVDAVFFNTSFCLLQGICFVGETHKGIQKYA